MDGPWENYATPAPTAEPWQQYGSGGSPAERRGSGPWDALVAGYQGSATGLALRGKLPDVVLDPSHAKWYEKAIAGASSMVSELPEMVAGGIAGAAAGTAIAPGPGTIVGAGAGTFAVPTAIRESLIQAYQARDAVNSADFLSRAAIVLKETGKSALVGGLTAGAGSVAARTVGAAVVGEMGTQAAMRTIGAAQTAAEIGTMTVAPAALEGKLPDPVDFANAAIMVVGMKAAGAAAGKIAQIYAKTGVEPEQVVADSKSDQSIPLDLKPVEAPVTSEKMVTVYAGQRAVNLMADGTPVNGMRFFAEQLQPPTKGNAYKVQIPQRVVDNMLDWDKPLSEQSPTVQALIQKTAELRKQQTGNIWEPLKPETKGAELVKTLGEGRLKESGITGIRYLDGVSRKAGEGTSNYVLFDAKHATVIERNGETISSPTVNQMPEVPRAYQSDTAANNAQQAIPEPAHVDPRAAAMVASPFAAVPQAPGEPKVELHPNYDYINTSDDAKAALARASELYGDKILAQTRGQVSWAQTEQEGADKLAQMIGVNDMSLLADRQPGTGAGTTEMYLRGQLMMGAVEDFTRRAQAYDALTASPEDAMKMQAAAERVAMLSATFQGAASETGRALNALKMVNAGLRQADAIAKLMEGSPDPAKVAEAMQGVDNPVAAAAVARMVFEPNALTTNQKFLQVRNAALLMGFKVPQVKAIGDGIAWASAIVDRAYAMGIGLFTSGDKVTSNEIMGFIAGSKAGTANALKVAAGIWEGATMPKGGKNPFGYRTVFGEGAQAGEPSQPPAEGTAAARANKVISFPHRVIATETEFLREINKSGESRALAIRQAITEKLQPGTDEFNSRVHEIEQNPTPERQAAIDKAGADATFTGELGKYGKALQAFAKTPIGGYIVPFTVVPANLVSWAVRRLPGAAFILDDVRADMAKGGAVRDLAIARQLVGATVATAAYGAVKSGILTGGGMGLNPDQKRAKMDAGWQPYSIKVGDKYYGYNRFEPLARIMSLAADVAEIGDHLAEDDKASLPLMVGAMFGNAVVSQTYLSGLNNFMKALDDPAKMAPMVFDQFVGSWVPAFLAQTAAATDKTTRRVDNAFDAIQNRLPYFRNQMLPQINELTGEPKQNRSSLLPIDMSKISKDPVLSEAARLGVGVAKAPKSIELPAAHQREIGKVELTPEQQNIFSSVAGRIAHQALSNLVDTDRWDALPDISKKRAFEISIALGRKIGKAESLTPEQRETEVERIRDEIMEKLNK